MVSLNNGSESLASLILLKLKMKGCTQKELAKSLGKHESTLSLWLSGEQTPRLDEAETIIKLAKFLQKTPAQLKELILASKDRTRSFRSRFDQPHTVESLCQFLNNLPRPRQRESRLEIGAVSKTLGENELEKTFARDLARDSWARDAVQRICRLLDDKWGNAPDQALTHAEFAGTIRGVLSKQSEEFAINSAALLKRLLLRLRLVEESPSAGLKRRWPINSSFVINSLFGLPTNIRNLDWLLDGGLTLPPGKGGGLVLIKGKPGTGKTMLALQLAASIAAAGHLAIYLTAEQRTSLLLGQLDYAGFHVADHDSISMITRENMRFALLCDISDNFGKKEIVNELQAGSGMLAIASLPSTEALQRVRKEFQTTLDLGIRALTQRSTYTFFFVDSIDGVLNTHQRAAYRELFKFVSDKADLGILISETGDESEEIGVREHLVDMVFRLGYRTERGEFKSRVLEIEKCRTQSAIRGEHRFAIHRGRGISLYPSVQSLLSVWRRRLRSTRGSLPETWALEGLDMSSVLAGDALKGSAMLISGPPATHKLPLGLSFLAAGIAEDLKESRETSYLLISLREDPASLARIITVYPQLHPLLASTGEPFKLNACVSVVYVPPDYFTADRFLDWMRDELARLAQEQKPISRVLFSSLNQLFHNSPMCRKEPLLIPALIELFKKKGVTSLFLAVGDEHNSEIQDIFDTIIFTKRGRDDERNKVRLMVGHSGPCNADREAYTLRRIGKDGSARLVLSKDENSGRALRLSARDPRVRRTDPEEHSP